MMANRLVIIGAGGFGRGLIDLVQAVNTGPSREKWEIVGVCDDGPSNLNLERLSALGVQYLGSVAEATAEGPEHFVVGINHPGVRQRISVDLESKGWQPATLIHPDTTIETTRIIGSGTVIRAGCRIATNAELGRHVQLNYNVMLGHDVVLNDFVSVNPTASVSGEVTLHTRTLVGAGSVVLQGLSVGADAIIGAAACVTRNVEDGMTVAGIPARPLSA